ncbi:MAG: C_GCAxxG_C_C family protein [Oscillospiraceae bacterium]|nr:C_GCAxxG_C_C family protein [Oscillospiraceae bacterium]
MNRYEIALKKHAEGFNCCASVLFAYQDKTKMSDELCYGVSSGLGGGFRTGSICGAVSGAVIVLGILHPHNEQTGAEGKTSNMKLTQEFQRRYAEREGAVDCRDLKPVPAKHEVPFEGREMKNCDHYILAAVELLDEMIEKYSL